MVEDVFSNIMSDMGDSKMSTNAHLFYHRGEASDGMKNSVRELVKELEEGGIEMPEGTEAITMKIIQSIHSIVKQGVGIG